MNGSFQKPWRSQANTEKKVWSNLAANFPPKAESFVWKRMKKGELSTWEQIKSDFFRSTKEIEKQKIMMFEHSWQNWFHWILDFSQDLGGITLNYPTLRLKEVFHHICSMGKLQVDCLSRALPGRNGAEITNTHTQKFFIWHQPSTGKWSVKAPAWRLYQ
jgi:hypothetical protein